MPSLSRVRPLACLVPLLLAACGSETPSQPPAPTWPTPKVDLRADNNRNGTVDLDDPTEDEGEDSWDEKHGAIFLANIDDDLRACPTSGLGDNEYAACNDGANDVVDGENDILDLAPLKIAPWAEVPEGARGTLEIDAASAPFVRLFRHTPDGYVAFDPATVFTSEELEAGIDFALEGKDVVRDTAVWSGAVDITFRVAFDGVPGGRPAFDEVDKVRLHIAPVLLQHHLSKAEKVFTTNIPESGANAFRADVTKAVTAAGTKDGMEAMSVPEYDPWTQDFFETGYMSMPAAGGGQHVIRVAIRSANIYNPRSTRSPLRAAGRVVWTKLRGPDVAGIQQFDPKSRQEMDSLNSFGNTETIPPFEHNGKKWPLGRIIRGATTSFYPDKTMAKLFAAQAVQEPVLVDTSWLLVGHIDESISFVASPKPGPRSFLLLANDARMAKKILEDAKTAGHGGTKMFVGKKWLEESGEVPAERTIDAILGDADIMAASAKAAAEVDAQIEILKEATGITPDEIVPIPFLHFEIYEGSVAYQPGMVNSLVLDGTHIASPNPHGPTIEEKDPFKTSVETSLAAQGIQVSWVEDWDAYHRNLGEVHCGSNVFREIPTAKWWEAAR